MGSALQRTLPILAVLGGLFMIASAFLFAATVILFKGALATVHETDALYFQNAVGALVFLPFLLAETGRVPPPDLALGLIYGTSVGLVPNQVVGAAMTLAASFLAQRYRAKG